MSKHIKHSRNARRDPEKTAKAWEVHQIRKSVNITNRRKSKALQRQRSNRD